MNSELKKQVLEALRIGHEAQSVLAKHYLLVQPDGEDAQEYMSGRRDIQKAIAAVEAEPDSDHIKINMIDSDAQRARDAEIVQATLDHIKKKWAYEFKIKPQKILDSLKRK